MTACLLFGDGTWCDGDDIRDVTDDPRDARCLDCLNRAAAYGAAAAMRAVAVENGEPRDPELIKERDDALRRLNAIQNALEGQHAFFCHDCMKLCSVGNRAMSAGQISWCTRCAPKREPA